jgi:hypothetical protein
MIEGDWLSIAAQPSVPRPGLLLTDRDILASVVTDCHRGALKHFSTEIYDVKSDFGYEPSNIGGCLTFRQTLQLPFSGRICVGWSSYVGLKMGVALVVLVLISEAEVPEDDNCNVYRNV